MRIFMLLFLQLFVGVHAALDDYTLIASDFTTTDFTTNEGWSVSNGIDAVTMCGQYRIFGGADNFIQTTIQKTFTIPHPHYAIKIAYKFLKIDSWDNESFKVLLNGVVVYDNQSYTYTEGTQLCGMSEWPDMKDDVEIIINDHFSETVTITMFDVLDQTDESWGIYQFELWAKLCPEECQQCQRYNF